MCQHCHDQLVGPSSSRWRENNLRRHVLDHAAEAWDWEITPEETSIIASAALSEGCLLTDALASWPNPGREDRDPALRRATHSRTRRTG